MKCLKLKSLNAVSLGTLLLAGSSLLSRLLGVLRDYVFAKIFGLGEAGGDFVLDAYYAAFRIPDFLYTLLIFGALSAAFVPIYTRLKQKNQVEASDFASHVLNFLIFVLLLASVSAWFLAPQLIQLFGLGFDPEVMALSVRLTRIMLLSPFFFALSAVFQGIENAHKTFWGIALAPIVYNVSIIVAAWFWGLQYGVYALAWGVVIGAAAHFLVQVPGALMTPFRYRFEWRTQSKAMKDFFRLTLPRLFGLSVTQFGLFVDTAIASLLALGSLSVFNYALNLQSIAYGVVAISLSVAVFSTLSEQAEQPKLFLKTMRESTYTLLFWALPAVVGLFMLREQVVELILLGGSFDEAAAATTAFTLGIFVWAAIGQSFVPLFARAFYALHETKIPVLIAFVSVLVSMGLSLVLTQVYNFEVWALAVSAVVSQSLNAVLLILFLGRFMKVSAFRFFEKRAAYLLLPTLCMWGVLFALQQVAFSSLALQLLVLVSGGGVVYFGVSRFLPK